MGKRSSFARVVRDFYPTPPDAVWPLVPHLPHGTVYWEPCAGAADLWEALCRVDDLDDTPGIECGGMIDIEPRHRFVSRGDALNTDCPAHCTHIITNPPWAREILHPMITRFSNMRPTWLLFDADWIHTRQAAPFMPRLHKVVSVGRVKWIKDSPFTGKDNCAWHLFDLNKTKPTEFYGRT